MPVTEAQDLDQQVCYRAGMDDVRSAGHRLIVSIIGPSNGGKSQLARHVAALAGANEVCRVPTDYFLVPRARGESLEGFWARPLE